MENSVSSRLAVKIKSLSGFNSVMNQIGIGSSHNKENGWTRGGERKRCVNKQAGLV